MPVFFSDDDYRVYLELMNRWCDKHQVEIWAYCLMPNHVHLVAVPSTAEGLRLAIGEAHRRYTRHINFRERWRGHLWQERFASFPMDEQHLLAAVRYVELNPVRAGLVRAAGEWEWSSALAHLTEQAESDLLTLQPMLDRVDDWRSFLEDDLPADEMAELELHSRTGRPLGSSRFIDDLEGRLNRSLRKKKPGRKRLDDRK